MVTNGSHSNLSDGTRAVLLAYNLPMLRVGVNIAEQIMKKIAIAGLVGLCVWTGCSATEDTGPEENQSLCMAAKCDGNSIADLQPIATQFGNCEVVPDPNADEFFAIETWNCQFVNFEEGMPAKLESVYTWAESSRGPTNSVNFDLGDSSKKRAAGWRVDDYPITTTIRTIASISTSDFGRLGSPNISTTPVIFETKATHTTRPTQTLTQEIALPMEFWPVVIWPTAEFAQKFAENNRYFMVNIEGEVETSTRSQQYTHGRYATQNDDLRQLPAKTFFLPVQDGKTPTLEVRMDGNDPTSTTQITGPGYYLLQADGSVVKVSAQEVLEKGMSQLAGEEPTSPEPEPQPNPGTSNNEPSPEPVLPEPEPEVDPCNNTCSTTQTCVNAACVPLANQTQSTSCTAPRAACETNSDCADGHACAEGLCRRLSCQVQSTNCYAATAICELNTDCADGHACVDGLCRRLTCQSQSSNCSAPTAVCNLDADCNAGHACAGGLCRRLTCQTQSSNCYAPTAVCDGAEASDCADGHVCDNSLCKRLTCVR